MTEQTKQNIINNVQTFKRPTVDVYEGIIKPLLRAGQERKQRFITVCCVCQRWDNGEHWTDSSIPSGQQTHTYCPVCFEEAIKEIKQG